MARSQSRIRLTKQHIDKASVPPGKPALYLYDDLEASLAVRVGMGGRKVFVWCGREDGRYVREILGPYPAMTIEQARMAAKQRGVQAHEEAKKFDSGVPDGMDITIDGAFESALAATKRGERSKVDWQRSVDAFMEWLRKRYPAATHWKHVSRVVVDDYLSSLRKYSDNTQRLALNPIKQTARRMSHLYDFRNVGDGLDIGKELKTPPPKVYIVDVLAFLEYLQEHAPYLQVGAALHGLVGLRLSEAQRLTWDKIDLRRGLVEISGETKNAYSQRIIPVCSIVKELLERAYDETQRGTIREPNAHVVLSERGLPYTGGSWQNYPKALGDNIKRWNPKARWAPKDLRNSLPTFAATRGLLSVAWEAYIGHAARGVTAIHYVPRLAAGTIGEGEALETAMDVFRRLVVGPIEQAIQDAREGRTGAGVVEILLTAGVK